MTGKMQREIMVPITQPNRNQKTFTFLFIEPPHIRVRQNALRKKSGCRSCRERLRSHYNLSPRTVSANRRSSPAQFPTSPAHLRRTSRLVHEEHDSQFLLVPVEVGADG